VRHQVVGWREEKGTASGLMVRISPDGAAPEWMLARDLARPQVSPPPAEVGGSAATEKWIDVHLGSQTLVAYEGLRPVYATLVSTGRGGQKSDSATPAGVHRVWVKIVTSTMDNVEREDVGRHYSMEDVPYVQFFAKAVALHAAFWHRDFGRVRSHGCVNLAPHDAKWLFSFTAPHVPTAWHAAYPTKNEKGTAIRVRL
jgi:lipoprotein-anchoring transpeptidase ErfK/SrfK